jgi:hypothetical protein
MRILQYLSLLLFCVAASSLGYHAMDLYRNGVRTRQDWLSYRIVRSDQSPIGQALIDGRVVLGTPRSDVHAVQPPLWVKDRGRIVVYGYHPKGYSSRNVVFVDDVAVSARASSCTWSWTYFSGEIPVSISEAMYAYDQVRDAVARLPDSSAGSVADALQPNFDRVCRELGLPLESLRELAEQNGAPESP